MPSEIPRMPRDTHQAMLGHGGSNGLGLQAGEVAWVKAKMKSRLKVTIIVLSLVIALGAVVVVNGFIYG